METHNTVLVFLSETRQACSDYLSGIYRFSRKRDWNVRVIERLEKNQQIKQLLRFWTPIGCIVENGGCSMEFDSADFRHLPTVFIDRNPDEIPQFDVVHLDCRELGVRAAKLFLSCEFAQYGYVGYRVEKFWCRERRETFVEALRLNGVEPVVFDHPVVGKRSRRLRSLVSWLKSLSLPCGLFAANDGTAEEILAACAKARLRVPDDVSVCGVDDDVQLCDNAAPPLSSFRCDRECAGYKAAEALAARIADPLAPRQNLRYPVQGFVRRLSLRRSGASPTDVRVLNIQEFVRQHACEGIGIADVARAVGCSRRLAELRFREACGTTLGEAIRTARFMRACDLLRQSNFRIAELAGQCGYASEDALERMFRRREGCTPQAWRARHALPGLDALPPASLAEPHSSTAERNDIICPAIEKQERSHHGNQEESGREQIDACTGRSR